MAALVVYAESPFFLRAAQIRAKRLVNRAIQADLSEQKDKRIDMMGGIYEDKQSKSELERTSRTFPRTKKGNERNMKSIHSLLSGSTQVSL